MKIIVPIAFLLIITSCTPTISYLGDTYPVSQELDIYYDAQDIDRDYKVMGHLTHDLFINYNVELIRDEMIRTARTNGADGILFSEYSTTSNADCDTRRMVKASLVKYL